MEQAHDFSDDQIIEKVRSAVWGVLQNDMSLLETDANEASIAGAIYYYLRPLFPGWDVDLEYNRDGYEPKRVTMPRYHRFQAMYNEPNLAIPDIIVHTRKRNDNLLAIELKKSSNPDKIAFDFDKLKLLCYKRQLGYKLCLFVIVNTDGKLGAPCTIETIEDLDEEYCSKD